MKSFLYYVIFYLKYALAGLNSGSFIRNLSDGIENLPYINNLVTYIPFSVIFDKMFTERDKT